MTDSQDDLNVENEANVDDQQKVDDVNSITAVPQNNRIVNSFVWKLLERILSQGINFIVQIILARILMPEDFASLALIVVFVNYASIFVQSGLSTAIVQKQNLEKEDISTLLVSSLGIALIFYLIIFFTAPVIANYYDQAVLKSALRVLGIVLFFNAINSIQLAILQREMKFKSLFIRSIIAVPISGVVGITMAYLGCGIWALVVYNLVNIFLMVFIIMISSRLHIGLKFSMKHAKTLYSFSGKILLSSLVSGLSDSVRTASIGHRYTKSELAYYDKAYTYSFYFVQIVGYSISSVMLPVLSREQDDADSFKRTARMSISLSTFFMFPFLMGIIVAARPLIITLLTDKWSSCIPYLILFCTMRLPECMIAIDKQAIYSLGKSGICLLYEVILCVLNLSALFICFNFGVIYIALGAAIVGLISAILISVISKKVYNYKIIERIKDTYKPLINSIIMAASIYFIQFIPIHNVFILLLQFLVGVGVYFFLAWLTKDSNLTLSIQLIKKLIRKKRTN